MAIYYLVLLVFGLVFIGIIFFRILEPAYMLVFNKPIYIYWYPLPKKLQPNQKQILATEFPFFKKLSKKKQNYFEHRVKTVVNHYQFVGNDGVEVTNEMKIIIAGTYVMLTFGMRHYLVSLFTKISNYFLDTDLNKQLLAIGYFRDYAYTNQFEFLAVVLEHYFETPMEFKLRFPELFENVSKMLNHKHY